MELILLDELQDGHGCELLGYRGQPEIRILINGHNICHVSETIISLEDLLTLSNNQQCGTGPLAVIISEHLVYAVNDRITFTSCQHDDDNKGKLDGSMHAHLTGNPVSAGEHHVRDDTRHG